ncbi:MAG: homoserine dehydrogenase [Acidobacteriota bacterium]|nr:homoserine dehydrogenase [Blastocatellia bacterium]MDW8411949.1 homoserine dehydrogenase [Acidobacteriota bacterium]
MVAIGFLGFGTVGSGAVKILSEGVGELERRAGCSLRIKSICSRSIFNRDRSVVPSGVSFTVDAYEVIDDPEIDIVVEAIGGIEPAREYLVRAIEAGKSVVTANKALLSRHGLDLAKLAMVRGVALGIEASVAGGVPVLTAIREGLAGESFERVYGILNGTTNYILTEMERSGKGYGETLAEAQALGYAEADPSLDVEGLDARDKLAILCTLCFGGAVSVESIPTIGISSVESCDVAYASDLGYTIRLVCRAERCDGKLVVSVRPTLVGLDTPFGRLRGAMNAVLLVGRAGGSNYLQGKGAGAGPTGVAIVSDIVRIARGEKINPLGYVEMKSVELACSDRAQRWMLRMKVCDRAGIVAKLGEILASHEISIDAVLQNKRYTARETLPFIITLNETSDLAVQKAVSEIARQDFVVGAPTAYPILDLG